MSVVRPVNMALMSAAIPHSDGEDSHEPYGFEPQDKDVPATCTTTGSSGGNVFPLGEWSYRERFCDAPTADALPFFCRDRAGCIGCLPGERPRVCISLDAPEEVQVTDGKYAKPDQPSVQEDTMATEPTSTPQTSCRSRPSRPSLVSSSCDHEIYDVFLSHLQRNGQDAVIAMQAFLEQAVPDISVFIDLDVDMNGDLQGTLRDGVLNCGAFVFFITDGILQSEWCLQEYRWALEFGKKIVLVRETDMRHGGIEMGAFLQQVPADLRPSFQNNIAIPWYRQPAFRNISMQEIIQATGVGNKYDVEVLHRARNNLEACYFGDPDPTTAFEIIAKESLAMRVVFFLGGFATFRNKCLNYLYVVIFNVSYWTCGLLCLANLVYQTVPYQIFATDALTAYVHLPAWQSWHAWRKFVKSKDCDELLTKVCSNPCNQARIGTACRISGWCVLIVQLLMVSDVLVGFALPYVVGAGTSHSTLAHLHYTDEFTGMHAWSMWIVIPPVIAAMFASYSMFAFIALLHILDIWQVRAVLSQCLLDAIGKRAEESVSSQDDTSWDSDGEDDLEANLRRVAVQEKVLEAAANLLVKLLERVQKRIDRSCSKLGALWLHLVFFSTCQVLAITSSLRKFAMGVKGEGYHFNWWWAAQDFFHLAGGIVLLSAAMGIFSVVTVTLNKARRDTLLVFIQSVTPPQKLATSLGVLATRPLGMHILKRSLYIDVPKVLGFLCMVVLIVLKMAIDSVNGMDTW